MNLDKYNNTKINDIAIYKRRCFGNQDALLLCFDLVGSNKKRVKRSFNIPKKIDRKFLLIEWLLKMGVYDDQIELDLKNPHMLSLQIQDAVKGKVFPALLQRSKCKRYVNVVDVKAYIK